ncbi:hypothetical protein BDY17DRAFT_109874 [Neohortaea acidophila]|uniref:Ataxin-10 homolog n=1 Tax=Neohortaea acidophila TaxID=245834 RepID=A0A6A6Q0W9_9PEZI|nr:uncharacterized protein BDY17DRAFT_109874 [Neohortaea acidophila]KAF2485671.1 hypothetical protein BDY17DRAFT_109874 [Neohortaea acidophila]
MARDEQDEARLARAHSVFIRLALPPYTIHFKSPTYLQPSTLDLLDKKVCKETLKTTGQIKAVRLAIGGDGKFWAELVLLLRAAVPSLERRSFSVWDPSSVDYESTSGALIAANYPGLWRDLDRLNDFISIMRNLMTVGATAQDLAAEHTVDYEVFRLINCCVRVTARGYDGDSGTGEEEKWQWIVNAYKKLLITSLQFLNNFSVRNEERQLALWVSLFDGGVDLYGLDHRSQGPEQSPPTEQSEPAVGKVLPARPTPPVTGQDILLAYGTDGNSRVSPLECEAAIPIYKERGQTFKPLPPQINALVKKNSFVPNGYAYFTHLRHATVLSIYQQEHARSPSLGEIHRAMPTLWEEERAKENRSEKMMWEYWQAQFNQAYVNYTRALEAFEEKMLAPSPDPPAEQNASEPSTGTPAQPTSPVHGETFEDKIKTIVDQLTERYRAEWEAALASGDTDTCRTISEGLNSLRQFRTAEASKTPVEIEDLRMNVTAETGVKVLENGKAELMKKLEGYAREDLAAGEDSSRHSPSPEQNRRRRSAQSLSDAFATDSLGSEEEEEEEEGSEEDDDDDYPASSEDGRGLLTDVPLILGPNEIETLPMLVMSAIVPDPKDDLPPQKDSAVDYTPNSLRTLRTHLLLSQTAGRNLLRELLIFVAAWDLREGELYFKFMVKVMESILKNGLMPYAYHAFRDRSRSKDIISPAQAVIMKLLTCIFRERNSGTKEMQQIPNKESITVTVPPPPPGKVELHILNFVFTEFRQHIIPQTCALIFLQGQIHKGRASPDDFPLNLWDMERMYEGVYQFLEFFAVLAEEQVGGRMPADMDKELGERFSWKKILANWEMASELVTLLRELEGGIPKMVSSMAQVSKRMAPPALPQRSLSADAATMPTVSVDRPFELDDSALPPLPSSASGQIFEAETPLAYPEDPIVPTTVHDQDEPSDFEWRNLKKLTVLVLSSLIWKNKQVQDQVRQCGGLEALVSCCKPDEHNPYIREHAIMCLRFAVEGNDQNIEVIRNMARGYGTQARSASASAGLLQSADAISVPREVLDTNGYETFMDSKGQVGLRRKDKPAAPPPSTIQPPRPQLPAAATAATASLEKSLAEFSSVSGLTAEKAAELMQNALRDLPLGEKLVTSRQKAEALAKLDKAFESSEKALGKGKKG